MSHYDLTLIVIICQSRILAGNFNLRLHRQNDLNLKIKLYHEVTNYESNQNNFISSTFLLYPFALINRLNQIKIKPKNATLQGHVYPIARYFDTNPNTLQFANQFPRIPYHAKMLITRKSACHLYV